MKCPYCDIDLDLLNMTNGLKHILEHKKRNTKITQFDQSKKQDEKTRRN